MKIRNTEFDTQKNTYIMGILNVTPDSFSDGGKYDKPEKALRRAKEMIEEGVDIIDVGGESTRPGYTPLSANEEMERVLPVIEKLRKEFDVPISLDTSKASVAEAGILAGADLINDIWGLKKDEKMAGIIAGNNVACVLMHNRVSPQYSDFFIDVMKDMEESLQIAQSAGIEKDRIILDPGIGFAKSQEQNLEILARLKGFHSFGLPLLLAASRKSVIGYALNLEKEERLEGTLAISTIAAMNGCGFVRVHDIKENVRAVKMALAVRNKEID